ncbi:MAG: ABC transporter substrate-binding protein [Anaerolineae bacterium]|nr:ABC transporter substrate-binding protein [Anaerolineae bacterium]
MLRHNNLTLIVTLVLLALVTGTLALAQQPAVLRLGLLAAADSPAGRGAQLAIAEINGAGGITGPDGSVYVLELLSVPVQTAEEVRAGLQALADRELTAILGPDDTAALLGTLGDVQALGVTLLTGATGNMLTITDTTGLIFRARAPEQVYVQAAADYVVAIMPQPVLAIVQMDTLSTESVVGFTSALSNSGVFPLTTIQVNSSDELETVRATIVNLNPGVLTVWGGAEDAVALLRLLRESGWNGLYFYRDATSVAFQEALLLNGNLALANGVLGVTNWVPGVRSTASDAFLRNYVTTFGSVPTDLSATYYDAVYLVATAVRQSGAAPSAVQGGLRQIEAQVGVQGVFDPAAFAIGETTNVATIAQLNPYAAPQVQSLFVNGQLVANAGGGQVVALGATATPTITPTTTSVPATATPEGVWGTVASTVLNVRSGPSTSYDVIGQLSNEETIFPIGANNDFSWVVISFRGTAAWVFAGLIELHGDLNSLPIIVPPPSPTPMVTPTLTPVPYADLLVAAATVEPVNVISGQAFTVRATVRNAGAFTSIQTALAATFQPGDVFASVAVPPLAPGQAIDVVLMPTVNGGGTFTVQLVVDLNNLVDEGPSGETNNLFPVSYSVDHSVLDQGQRQIGVGRDRDLVGSGTPDFTWDGFTLAAINGARIMLKPDLSWGTLTWSQLGDISGTQVTRDHMPANRIIGLHTAEGYRAALRIDNFDGDTFVFSYRVYAP